MVTRGFQRKFMPSLIRKVLADTTTEHGFGSLIILRLSMAEQARLALMDIPKKNNIKAQQVSATDATAIAIASAAVANYGHAQAGCFETGASISPVAPVWGQVGNIWVCSTAVSGE